MRSPGRAPRRSSTHAKNAGVVVQDTSFTGGGTSSTYGYGAIVGIDNAGTVSLTDVTFSDVTQGLGVLTSWGHGDFRAERVFLTGNSVDAAFYLIPAEAGTTSLDAIATCGNPGTSGGFALLGPYDFSTIVGPIDVRQLTMTDARGPLVDDAIGGVSVTNSLIMGTPSLGDHVAWSFVGTDTSGAPSGVTTMDAGLGALESSDCAWALLQPDPIGPAANSGDPSISDRDGSGSDLGALGGPMGFQLGLEDDADRDKVGWYHDCDDEDAARFPGNDETAYDGVDQDCDGSDLCDQDGDGFDHESCGGEDCDDQSDAVRPGAVEVESDGIDQDCNGEDLEPEIEDTDGPDPEAEPVELYIAGACSTAPGLPYGMLASLLALMAVRRRA